MSHTDNSRAAVRVCAIADIECSRNCGTGPCKRETSTVEQPEAAPAMKLLGEMRENGVVWFDQNPHAFPLGTKFYAEEIEKRSPAPLEGTGNGADERAAQVADYMNAPGMWAQVYCCAVFVRGWPSDMARSAADEAVKEFGDAACKTVADLVHTLDEVLRVD